MRKAMTAIELVAIEMERAIEVGECLEWQGMMGNTGKQVPIVRSREGKTYSAQVSAPRVLWEQKYGPIPAGMVLWRECCNNKCVKLSHLRLGTRVEWNRHRTEKGLFKHTIGHILNLTKGARNRATTVNTLERARQVRALLAQHSRKEVAQITGISQCMVNDIALGRSWKDHGSPWAGLGGRGA